MPIVALTRLGCRGNKVPKLQQATFATSMVASSQGTHVQSKTLVLVIHSGKSTLSKLLRKGNGCAQRMRVEIPSRLALSGRARTHTTDVQVARAAFTCSRWKPSGQLTAPKNVQPVVPPTQRPLLGHLHPHPSILITRPLFPSPLVAQSPPPPPPRLLLLLRVLARYCLHATTSASAASSVQRLD